MFTDIPEEETNQQILEVISKTGQTYEIALETLSLSERTSNGSFISDTISDQEVLVARTR